MVGPGRSGARCGGGGGYGPEGGRRGRGCRVREIGGTMGAGRMRWYRGWARGCTASPGGAGWGCPKGALRVRGFGAAGECGGGGALCPPLGWWDGGGCGHGAASRGRRCHRRCPFGLQATGRAVVLECGARPFWVTPARGRVYVGIHRQETLFFALGWLTWEWGFRATPKAAQKAARAARTALLRVAPARS